MRLLQRLPDNNFKLTSFNDDNLPPYAILSHTWTEDQEVTYNELVASTGKDKIGYRKIRFCGERAVVDGLEYFWVDTCCIDKSTSHELSTAINSMFRWYQRAAKCYVYLSDVSVSDEVVNVEAFRATWAEPFRHSRWFTRGWTLQELLAPGSVEFFSKEGKRIGSRISLEQDIHEVTGIPIQILREGQQGLAKRSVEERISWAANRTTKLKEDKVYCLLGIFGVFLPLVYGEGEAYATLRLREEIQRRLNGHGTKSANDLPVFSLLPFPRDELFIGREDELRALEHFLLLPNIHQRMAIHGLGGCGKSALALEFAYRALANHARRLVFWVPALSQESFELAYREIGIRLCIPGVTDDNADVKILVKEALSSAKLGEWLMIVDNADNTEVLLRTTTINSTLARLSDYLPYSTNGAILFTTRSRKAAGELVPSKVLELKDLGKVESKKLLTRRIREQALLNDDANINTLLEMLTYLPLAIVQAAAFINNNSITVSDYITLFEQSGAEIELFSEHFKDPSRYQDVDSTIAKTWHISFDQMRKQDPLAAEFLSFMACIDRINIPQSLLPSRESLVQQAKALGTLMGYAFITEKQQTVQEPGQERFFNMHRLVHLASRWWLDGYGERARWAGIAASRLEALVPYGGDEVKEEWIRYFSHATYVAGLVGAVDESARASLLTRVGCCQGDLGQYSAAEITYRQVLSLREKVLGVEHLDTLSIMSNLVWVLESQGKYNEAELLCRQALAIYKKLLGDEHPDTLSSMNYLALLLARQGNYDQAESMHRQTLVIQEKVLGIEHLDTLASMNNLAGVLDDQRKYDKAESIYSHTLGIHEKVLGVEHVRTLMNMNNLAVVLNKQGNYDKAELMYRRSRATCQKMLGTKHPNTLIIMSNLALLFGNQGKFDEAESMHRQILATRKKVLGVNHPDTLRSLSFLAGLLGNQGKYDEAESMHRQILATREKVLGVNHPDTLSSLSCLASLLENQHYYDESTVLYKRACAGYSATLGEAHPTTRACRERFSSMLSSQKRQNDFPLETVRRGADGQKGKGSRLSRALAKMRI